MKPLMYGYLRVTEDTDDQEIQRTEAPMRLRRQPRIRVVDDLLRVHIRLQGRIPRAACRATAMTHLASSVMVRNLLLNQAVDAAKAEVFEAAS